jgi:hypothetical protein
MPALTRGMRAWLRSGGKRKGGARRGQGLGGDAAAELDALLSGGTNRLRASRSAARRRKKRAKTGAVVVRLCSRSLTRTRI